VTTSLWAAAASTFFTEFLNEYSEAKIRKINNSRWQAIPYFSDALTEEIVLHTDTTVIYEQLVWVFLYDLYDYVPACVATQ